MQNHDYDRDEAYESRLDALNATISERDARVAELESPAAVSELLSRQNDAISQTLGKALGFRWYKDDQANFPGSTEENGVCVGDHVAESLAEMAAKEIEKLNRWKREAMSVMAEWDKVWVALGKPGQIGDKIPEVCKAEAKRLRDTEDYFVDLFNKTRSED